MPDDEARDQATERIGDAWQRLIYETACLGVDSGIVSAASSRWPLYALENFEEKLNGIAEWAHQQREELHGFAEAHDGETQDDTDDQDD